MHPTTQETSIFEGNKNIRNLGEVVQGGGDTCSHHRNQDETRHLYFAWRINPNLEVIYILRGFKKNKKNLCKKGLKKK